MADDVQPAGDAGGQGGDTTDSGLYDLDSVAPEVQEQLLPHLKAIEGNVTKKFQEAAEYKKGWEPYEELGLRDLEPGQLQQLLDFAKMANDPEQFSEWWQNAGKEMGLFEKGQDDPDLELDDELSQEKIAELIQEQVAEKLSPIQQTLQKQEQESQEAQVNKEIDTAMSSLRDEHKDLFGGDDKHRENVEDKITRLAVSYSDDRSLSPTDLIQKGFEDYKSLIGQGESSLLTQKAGQPNPPEGEGGADTSPEKITSFSDPRLRATAEERLRKSLST